MTITNKIITNIIGKPKKKGVKKDWDGDGFSNKKDCQPRNTMRQDETPTFITDEQAYQEKAMRINEEILIVFLK